MLNGLIVPTEKKVGAAVVITQLLLGAEKFKHEIVDSSLARSIDRELTLADVGKIGTHEVWEYRYQAA